MIANKSTDTKLTFYVIGASFLLHALMLLYSSNHPNIILVPVDSSEYLQAAKNLKNAGTLYAGDLSAPIDPGLFSRRPLLYPLFIAFLKSIIDSNSFIIVTQVLLNYLNGCLLWHIFSGIGTSSRARLFLTATYLFFPSQLIYTYTIMAEVLLQTLLLLGVYFLLFYFQKRKVRFLLLFNIAISCALLTKPILLYFWLPNILFHIWLLSRNRRRFSILFLPLLLLLTLLGSNYRNYNQTGYFHFSSIKSYNLLHCNTYLFLMKLEGRDKAEKFVKSVQQELTGMDFAATNRTIEKRCLTIIRTNWVDYTFFQLRGSLFFFLDPGRFDIYHFLDETQPTSSFVTLSNSGLEGIIQLIKMIPASILLFLLFVMIINTLLLLLFLASIFKKTTYIDMKIFLLLLITFFIVMVGPFGASRFRLVILPSLLICIGMLFQARQHRNRRYSGLNTTAIT